MRPAGEDVSDFDLDLGPGVDAPLTLRASELTRHAVVLGATGSGKTGLLVRLVEELLLGGVPVVALDPKGDLVNLANGPLKGLVDFTVLTPGSRAGTPLDIASIVGGPPDAVGREAGTDDEGLLLQLGDVVRGLLSLVGADAGPVDPPALLLSAVLEAAWRAGERPTLTDVVVRLVDPPFARLGAFPTDTVMPRKQRMELAVRLNGWLASPQLQAWGEGAPVDPDAWIAGRTRLTVVTLAHLDDALRQLAAGWVLSRLAQWSRRQAGSETLRLAVVLDEAWGFSPPAPRDPPTKRPLLQLAKQARAVGVGLISATQNPVDLDYALLSNAGTWFIGRLATPQDREKVSDGLSPVGRSWLADLPPRTFLVRRAGAEERLRTADTRTPLSGPVTLASFAALGLAAAPRPARPATPAPADDDGLLPRPPLGKWLSRFLDPEVAFSSRWAAITGPGARPARADGAIVWAPAALCRLTVRFDEGRTVVAERDEWRLRFPPTAAPVEPPLSPEDLLASGSGRFLPFEEPDRTSAARSAAEIVDHVFRGETERQFVHAGTKLRSSAGEAREAFDARVRAALETRADEAIRKLEAQVRKDVARLEDKRARVERTLGTRQADHQSRQATEVVGAGELLLGMLFGRRRSVSSAVSRRGATAKAGAAVEAAERELAELERELFDLEADLGHRVEALRNEHLRGLDEVEVVELRLEQDDVKVVEWSVLWIPVTRPV
jgi:hypothetical protein